MTSRKKPIDFTSALAERFFFIMNRHPLDGFSRSSDGLRYQAACGCGGWRSDPRGSAEAAARSHRHHVATVLGHEFGAVLNKSNQAEQRAKARAAKLKAEKKAAAAG